MKPWPPFTQNKAADFGCDGLAGRLLICLRFVVSRGDAVFDYRVFNRVVACPKQCHYGTATTLGLKSASASAMETAPPFASVFTEFYGRCNGVFIVWRPSPTSQESETYIHLSMRSGSTRINY